MSIWTKAFWASVFERAFFAFVNTLLSLPIMAQLDILSLDWAQMASAAVGAAVISLLKSIVVAGATDGNPSVVSTEVVVTPGQTADPVLGEQSTVVPDPTGEIADMVNEEPLPSDEVPVEAPVDPTDDVRLS